MTRGMCEFVRPALFLLQFHLLKIYADSGSWKTDSGNFPQTQTRPLLELLIKFKLMLHHRIIQHLNRQQVMNTHMLVGPS